MNSYMKKTMKIAGAVCAATGVVALSSLVACGAAVGAVVEGVKAAGTTVKKLLEEETQVNDCEVSKAEEQTGTGEEKVVETQTGTEEEKVVEEQASVEEMNATEMQTEDSGMNAEEAVSAVENNESV